MDFKEFAVDDEDDPAGSFGWIHSVIPGAAVDGPGLRYLVFLSGCAFRCLYCHNPDTWKLKAGTRQSVEEVLAGIRTYLPFLRHGGGVTVSGGEPLTQSGFSGRLLQAVKADLGLHTALDTQAWLAPGLPDSWFDPVDLILLDLKHINDQRHRELTGFSNDRILESALRFARLGKKLWIRHVVVPGWTDKLHETRLLADFVETLGPVVERVEILPFHQMGAHKWRELGLPYRLKDCPEATEDQAEAAREIFRQRGFVTA